MLISKTAAIPAVVILFTIVVLVVVSAGCRADQDMLHYRIEKDGKEHKIAELNILKVADAVTGILKGADSQYRMMITKKIISNIKYGSYIEIVFAEPKEILIHPVRTNKIHVKKILLGLQDGQFGWQPDGSCNIIFGDPDYGEYNIVIASNPHIGKEELIQMLP